MSKLLKSLIIEGVAATETSDNVGESFKLAGADISQLKRGFVNQDHVSTFDHLLGEVLDAKKIWSKNDCETAQQAKDWDRLKKPYLWVKAKLFDGYGHKQADSVASIYKYYTDKGQPPPIKLSVEGKVLERNGNALTRTLVRGIAVTIRPCNQETSTEITDILKSQNASPAEIESFMKHSVDEVAFRERPDDAYQRIYSLSKIALEMIQTANKMK